MRTLIKIKFLILIILHGIYSASTPQVTDTNTPVLLKTDTTNYFPLAIGNHWQYFFGQAQWGVIRYSIPESRIDTSFMINDLEYFKFSDYNFLMRYNSDEQIIYIRYNDSNYVYMDFSLQPGATFNQFSKSLEFRMVEVTAGIHSFWGTQYNFKGYKYGLSHERFISGIGLVRTYIYVPNGYEGHMALINGIIFDSTNTPAYISHPFYPEIMITPLLVTNSLNTPLSFIVDHYFSKFFPPSPFSQDLNFIKEVRLERFYQRADSMIIMPDINAYNTSTNHYNVNINLDENLLNDGFSYYYRIYAEDKGILPHISYSPDSGFYKLEYLDPNRIIENTNVDQDFSLSQNYPNPFNSATKIRYSLSKTDFVNISVYDVLGKKVIELLNAEQEQGNHEILFAAESSSISIVTGVYLLKLSAGLNTKTIKMIYLK